MVYKNYDVLCWELHISPHKSYGIIALIFITIIQPYNFYYNYELLQLFTSYLIIHLLTFCIRYIIVFNYKLLFIIFIEILVITVVGWIFNNFKLKIYGISS